jgi:hypothetical protein
VFQTESKVATINTMPADYLVPIKMFSQAQARAPVPLKNRMMYILLQNTDTHEYAYLA